MLRLPLPWVATPRHQLLLPLTPTTFSTHHRKSFPRTHPPLLPHLNHHLSSPPLFTSFTNTATAGSSDDAIDDEFENELRSLVFLLPENMQRNLLSHPDLLHLIEIVMDLGRTPLARFPSGDFVLYQQPITFHDLHHATSQVGDFGADNRAGISRTLHRISAIRNRNGVIVGLTCRVGRAVTGSADSLRDLVKDGASLLLIGPPGVGKTTIIREIARMLADDYKRRVMIVDTSNEIGGDGDIPHPGIGNARRMQVPDFNMQHKVLIEAVENHMPQAIIIDEIGTKLEAMAASTIAQRGIQLVATAHGVTIENLIMNPSLEMLVGGIQSVTLGDEEASRRGGQKTVLERKGPSTFTCGVEIISKTELRVHHSLETTVDALLSGRSPTVKICKIGSQGFTFEMVTLQSDLIHDMTHNQHDKMERDILESNNDLVRRKDYNNLEHVERPTVNSHGIHLFIRLFVYGIPETSVLQAVKQMRMDDMIQLSENIGESDAFLALHAKLKKNPQIHAVAKSRKLPVYVTKTNSLEQIAKAIRALVTKQTDVIEGSIVEDETSSSEKTDALEEVRLAIEKIVIPKGEPVELLPRPSHILHAQTDLVRTYNLKPVKVGKEPDTFIRILPIHSMSSDENVGQLDDAVLEIQDVCSPDSVNGSHKGLARLPLLPE